MKTHISYKSFPVLLIAILFSFSSLVSSCEKDGNNNGGTAETYSTSGNANGAQMNPVVTTNGTAALNGTYNTTTNKWTYDIGFISLQDIATLVEIHGPADAGVNANILFTLDITVGGTTGNASGTVTLTEQQEAWLLAKKLYYTIINPTFVAGEIRGQITATAQ